MSYKRILFALYILIILSLMSYCVYNELYNRQFDNIVDKNIVVTKVDKLTSKNGVGYTILDSENKTYFFSSAVESYVFNTIEFSEEITEVNIKYNTRNNEILEVRNGSDIDKIKYINWDSITIALIMVVAIILYFLLKAAIDSEWFFRGNRNDSE